jgi:hypothetical protein
VATFDDREVNVIVDINVFYLDQQASWVRADVTYARLEMMHHHVYSLSRLEGVGLYRRQFDIRKRHWTRLVFLRSSALDKND